MVSENSSRSMSRCDNRRDEDFSEHRNTGRQSHIISSVNIYVCWLIEKVRVDVNVAVTEVLWN